MSTVSSNTQTQTHMEVERKFAISKTDYDRLPEKLKAFGYSFDSTCQMTDKFLPTEKPGDMRRIRIETTNGLIRRMLTLKTWVEIGGSRERQETEEELGEQASATLVDIAQQLIKTDLPSFSKERTEYKNQIGGRDIKVALDTVQGLGHYDGFYMEVEVIVPVGDDVGSARQQIEAIATKLLGENNKNVAKSYMDMLYETSAKVR
jgi:predicted adenylyl cyclase CyaB